MLNCGISGNRVTNLLARWKKDCINLRPDVISILIGVNDVWHELSQQEGVDADLFEETYRLLLRYTKRMLPETKLILLGAYLTHGTATDGTQWDGDSIRRLRFVIPSRAALPPNLEQTF